MSTAYVSDVSVAIRHALGLIQSRFGEGATEENALPFHGVAHTTGVAKRATAIAKAMKLSDADVDLAAIAGLFHDTVQDWEENATQDGRVLRRRFAGQNEEASAAEAAAWMQANGYGEEDRRLVAEAVMATVPGWSPQLGTVIQPNLKQDSHPVVRAVALADIGVAGMDGELFTREGDPLFREENLDIARALRDATDRSSIPAATQDAYKARMLGWTRSQAGFARGRKAALEAELGNLDDARKAAVRNLFRGFDAAIAASDRLVAERTELSFWDLAAAMGYAIPAA